MSKNKVGCVYLAVCNINGKGYVGKTVRSIDFRRRRHQSDASRGSCLPFHRALIKYGFSNFSWFVLCKSRHDQLYRLEKDCVILMGTKCPDGYNLTDGGPGCLGHGFSETHRRRLSAALRGRKFSEAHLRAMSVSRRAIFKSRAGNEWRRKNGLAFKGQKALRRNKVEND